MDFLLHQPGVLCSLYISQRFHILQNESGWFSSLLINHWCDWALCVCVCIRVYFYDDLNVIFTVLELLPEALSFLTMSLLRFTVKMPMGVVVLGILKFLLHLPQDSLHQLWRGWSINSVDFGCIWFRDGLRYITPADVSHSTMIKKLLHSPS